MIPNTITTGANIENLEQVIAFIEEQADLLSVSTKKKFGLLIAVEEAFVNICCYAYPNADGDVFLSCMVNESNAFIVEVADSGTPFDVLSLPDPDTTAEIMERQIGGLGVHFIRTFTDHVSYRRENDQNILTMVLNRQEE